MINYLSYFNIDLNFAMRPIEITYNKCPIKERFKRFFSAFASVFILRVNVDKKNQDFHAEFFFIKSMKRPDYDELFYSIVGQCNYPKISCDVTYEYKSFSIKQLFDFFVCIPLLFKMYRVNPLNWFFMYVSFVKIYSQIRLLPKLNKSSHLVVFADMQPIDNMITQYAKICQIPTTTMQHGLYVDYEKNTNVNIVNYTNAKADNFLAWGQDTAKLIKKHHPVVNVFMCGKPTLKYLSQVTESNYFTVIFDQNIFFKNNIELLDIAYKVSSKLNLKVNMRLHPNNRIEWFDVDLDNTVINAEINSSKFVIGHTSSLIYECMRIGIPAYRYKTHAPALNTPGNIEFENANDLLDILDKSPGIQIEVAEYFIKYIDEASLSVYKKYFDEFKHKSPIQ